MKYVTEREIPNAGSSTDEQLREVSLRSLAVLDSLGPRILWLHSFVTDDEGTARAKRARARRGSDRMLGVGDQPLVRRSAAEQILARLMADGREMERLADPHGVYAYSFLPVD